MSRVYASTGCLAGNEPLHDRIKRYLDVGIDGIELGAGVQVRRGDLDRLDEKSARFLVHNYFPAPDQPFVLNLASPDAGIRKKSLELAERATELSHGLGAPFYSVHAGFITDPVDFQDSTFVFPDPPDDQHATGEATKRFIYSVNTLLSRTEDLGTAILIENNVCYPRHVGKLLLQSPEEFDRVFDEIDDPRLGILLDTGHLNVSARTLGFDRGDFVECNGWRIRGVHLHDNDGLADRHTHPRPESWTFDALRRLEPSAPAIVLEARFTSLAELAEAFRDVTRSVA